MPLLPSNLKKQKMQTRVRLNCILLSETIKAVVLAAQTGMDMSSRTNGKWLVNHTLRLLQVANIKAPKTEINYILDMTPFDLLREGWFKTRTGIKIIPKEAHINTRGAKEDEQHRKPRHSAKRTHALRTKNPVARKSLASNRRRYSINSPKSKLPKVGLSTSKRRQ